MVRHSSSGFTLVEVLIALALFVAIATGIAQLVAVATRALRISREHTAAVILAAAKLDQLRALEWTYEAGATTDPVLPRTDTTTSVNTTALANSGPGLQPSPAGSLAANTPPYVDYLDESARWVGNGAVPPPTAVFIRRWSVQPVASDPSKAIVLTVLVTTAAQDQSRAGPWRVRTGSEVVLAGVRTRRAE